MFTVNAYLIGGLAVCAIVIANFLDRRANAKRFKKP